MASLDRKLSQLRVLLDLSFLINSTLDIREIRNRATEAAKQLLDTEVASLLLVDQESRELFFEVALGEAGRAVREVRLKMGQGIAGWVAEQGEPAVIHDVYRDPRFFKDVDSKSSFVTRNMISVPVKSKDKILGVLQAINKLDGIFDEEDLEWLQILSNQVAVAIENAGLYEELRETFLGTVMSLADSLDKRDAYTGGHTRRVKAYSLAIGRRLGLQPQELEGLQLSAVLHDIGKIGVRDSILLKNCRLDVDELRSMQQHANHGAEILSHVKSLQGVVSAVKGHHENFDGTGYPDRLRGEDIPLFARIILVADSFDAMTSDRSYRKALSFDTAFAELNKFSGTQFDPAVVNAFIRAYEEGEI